MRTPGILKQEVFVAWLALLVSLAALGVSVWQAWPDHQLRASPLVWSWVADTARVEVLVANHGNRTEALSAAALYIVPRSEQRVGWSGPELPPLVLKPGDAERLRLIAVLRRAALVQARDTLLRDPRARLTVRFTAVASDGGQVETWVTVDSLDVTPGPSFRGRPNRAVSLNL